MKKQLLIYTLIILSFVFANTYENFELTAKDNNSFSIQFNLDQIELEEKNGYTKIIADSKGETSVIGMPKLPKFSTLVMINPGKKYDITYDVVDSYFIDDIDMKTNEGYSFYPIDNLSLSEPMVMRGLVLGQLSFIPYKYYADDKKIEG